MNATSADYSGNLTLVAVTSASIIAWTEGKAPMTKVALPAFAKSGSDQAKQFPAEFLNEYDIVYMSPGAHLDDVNCFLLGENHKSPECFKLNGSFIQAVGGTSPTVFVEGEPSTVEVDPFVKWKHCQELGLSSTTTQINGWDVSEEVQELFTTIPEITLIKKRKEIEKILKEIDENSVQLRLMQSYEETELVFKAIGLFNQVIAMQTATHEKLCRQEKVLAEAVAQGGMRALVRCTFPERTKAMVTTLEKLRGESFKMFFVAGVAHLRNLPILLEPEYDLGALHTELCHHKAAILIPKLFKSEIEQMSQNI